MTSPTARVSSARSTRFRGWEAIPLRRGPLELVLVPQVGGRVMGLRWNGQDLFFTQPELEGRVEHLTAATDLAGYRRRVGFPLWGGEKTWLAPQQAWIGAVPFPDLDSGAYRADPAPDGVRLTSPVCRETGIQIERSIRLEPGDGAWSVTQTLHNTGDTTVRWAAWDVTMVQRPGTVFLPRAADSAFPGGVHNFDAEGQVCAPDACFLETIGDLAAIRCDQPHGFKAGVDSLEGWLLAILRPPTGLLGYRLTVTGAGRPFPHGCALEVFNSPKYPYFELEALGPLAPLAPGASRSLTVHHTLFPLEREPSGAAEIRHLAEHGAEPPES